MGPSSPGHPALYKAVAGPGPLPSWDEALGEEGDGRGDTEKAERLGAEFRASPHVCAPKVGTSLAAKT